jgi:ferredoxin-NADP reductase
MLAGGMGITPFRSIMLQTATQSSLRPMALFYSSKTRNDMPFSDELRALSDTHPSFFVERFLTKEPGSSIDIKYRRMRFDDLYDGMEAAMPAEFLISGSLDFVLGLKNVLIHEGVNPICIRTESYF